VTVSFAVLDESLKRRHIHPMVAVGVELDRLAADQQEWHGLILVVERPARSEWPGKGLAEQETIESFSGGGK